ncbi:hypothetical protein KR038_005290 [Drosophila bunnanda]|nr:hypothetical protein KR038_005290 [Drosophila bunnanda]
MTNVEIYDTSNSELSSDEYSHEEDDDALMEAAVSKQASPPNSTMKAGADAGTGAVAKPKSKPSENPDDESITTADAAERDKITEAAAVVMQEPPSTTAETIRRTRKLQHAPFGQACFFFKRRSLFWVKKADENDENYQFLIKRKNARERQRQYTSDSRSVSYSRSNSRSLSRSRSRSIDRSCSSDRSRSGSQSPELICLDDTENEDSPEKPEEAKAANVTPIKENKAKIIKPPQAAQPQFEQQENEKSNENGTSSVLQEFLMIREPKQPSQAGIELDKLTASLELEQSIADTTLVQQDDQLDEVAEEPMVVNATLKRRRSVTPPLSNEKRRIITEEDDTVEILPAVAQNSVEATPVLKLQPSELSPRAPVVAPATNPIQSQPSFKLSSPYTLAPPLGPNAKQTINLAALSHSLNTPTPPAVPMEISFPTENLPHITKSNIVLAMPEQSAPPATDPVYGSSLYPSPLQWTSAPQTAHAQVGPQRDVSANNDSPRPAIRLQSVTSGAVQPPFGTERVLPPQVGPPRAIQPPTRVPLQVNAPRTAAPLQADPPRPTVPHQADPSRPTVSHQAATPLRPAPPQQQLPAQVQQEQPQVPVNATSFAVPQQPQPRRSETVSTQTQASQPESRPKSAVPDLKNSDANFHYRLKEMFPEVDTIFREKLDSMDPEQKFLIDKIDADVKALDQLLATKEDEWNRLFHLRCMKMELRGRVERRDRISIIKKLIPSVLSKGCSTEELYDMQSSLFGEHMLKSAFRPGPTSIEQCLNKVEVNQGDIERLRGIMGLKDKAPAASHYHWEEKPQQKHYRRNSMPIHQALIRELQDAEELQHQEHNCDLPPANKRPRLLRPQDR